MIYPTFSTRRSNTIDLFQRLRLQAMLASIHAKFSGKNTRLVTFAEHTPKPVTTRTYLGVQDVPLGQIIGSVNRENDFDSSFRPLNKHLSERWANVYELFESDDYPPIRVYKVGETYYVEDGHHRVSAARAIDRLSILAEVWEFPIYRASHFERTCQPFICLQPAECQACS